MADFETIRDAHEDLVLADLSLAVLFAPMTSDALDTLEDPTSGDLVALDDYTSAGIIKKDAGLSITSNIDSNDIEGYGETEPVRTIITKRTTRWNAAFIETNRETIEKYWGVNLDSNTLTVSAQGGVTVKAPPRPKNVYYRCILLGQDEVNGEDLFPYWIMPRVKLVDVDNQDFKDNDAIQYKMTFQAFRDSEAGFTVIQGWCGPGWRLLVDKTGFVSPPTSIDATPATTSIATGASQQITVTASNGINRTPNATYVSTNPATATVDATGNVTGVAAGTTTITVTYNPPTGADLTDTVAVTVT